MANHVLQKLGSMFTAAILCASCLPFGSVSAAGNNTADADISETIPNLVKSPEQLVQDAERGDFLAPAMRPLFPRKTRRSWMWITPEESTPPTFSC